MTRVGRRWKILIAVALLIGAAPAEGLRAERLYLASDIYSPAEAMPLDPAAKLTQVLQNARLAAEAGEVGRALQLTTQVAAFDSENADARRVLGYRRIGETWAGSYAARRLQRQEIWHSEFGWIKAADRQRYESGERPLGKRWVSADEDAARHTTIDKGWQIRTDHFRVTTNHSREAAAQLATRLETLYQVWQQLFGAYHLKSTELMKRFDGKEVSGYRSKPFEVIYYRTRDEYNRALRRRQPRIDMTLGIYFDDARETHFFAGEEQDAGTIYHEAVHQFFQESVRSSRNVGALSNAWLIEGVACYFESLSVHRDPNGPSFAVIGAPQAGRLPAARHRRLVDGYYIPLADLSALGIDDFQRRSDLPRLYSQSAGLVTFLMHYNDGVYRQSLVKALQLLYTGRDEPSTLEDLTGRRFEDLDREYRQYLESLPIATATR